MARFYWDREDIWAGYTGTERINEVVRDTEDTWTGYCGTEMIY